MYKLVEVEGKPVSKRSSGKVSDGGTKAGVRTYRETGVAVEEIIYPLGGEIPAHSGAEIRELTVPLIRDGEIVDGLDDLHTSRELVSAGIASLPWEGLALGRGEPAVPTRLAGF
mgnify:FL=1